MDFTSAYYRTMFYSNTNSSLHSSNQINYVICIWILFSFHFFFAALARYSQRMSVCVSIPFLCNFHFTCRVRGLGTMSSAANQVWSYRRAFRHRVYQIRMHLNCIPLKRARDSIKCSRSISATFRIPKIYFIHPDKKETHQKTRERDKVPRQTGTQNHRRKIIVLLIPSRR